MFLTLVIKSFERDSNKCSKFLVSTATGCNSSHNVGPLIKLSWSSRISLQNNLTVFFCFNKVFVGAGSAPLWCNWTPKKTGGGKADFDKGGGGGINPGIGGGGTPFRLGGGGGGGGPKALTLTDGFNGSLSSSCWRSVKSRSQICNGLSKVSSKLSQWSSFSDFFDSTLPVGESAVFCSLKLRKSWRDLDLVNSSLALEIMPLKSPSRLNFSSVGDVGFAEMWLACWKVNRRRNMH